MKEFFDHYLKGAAAPDWLEYGVPRLKMQEHIDQRSEGAAGQGEGQGQAGRHILEGRTAVNINVGRVLLGGLVAGVVGNALDFVNNTYLLASDMAVNAQRLNLDPALLTSTGVAVSWIVVDFLFGFLLVFAYAAMRPRFGPGPKTAIVSSVTLYLAVTVVLYGFMRTGFFTELLFLKASLYALVISILSGLAGAAVYKE